MTESCFAGELMTFFVFSKEGHTPKASSSSDAMAAGTSVFGHFSQVTLREVA